MAEKTERINIKARVKGRYLILSDIPKETVRSWIKIYSKLLETYTNKGTMVTDIIEGQKEYKLPDNFRKKKYKIYVNRKTKRI